MIRVIINLKERENEALMRLADREYRDPRMQAALLIRQALEKENLLPADSCKPKKQGSPQ